MAERFQPLPGTQGSQPVDEYDVYYDAIGGPIRGQLYDLRDSASTFYGATAMSSTARSHAPSSNLQVRLEEQEETIRAMREENASIKAENVRHDAETAALRAENARRDAETVALRRRLYRSDRQYSYMQESMNKLFQQFGTLPPPPLPPESSMDDDFVSSFFDNPSPQ